MKTAVAALAFLLVGCDDRPQQWDAFVYPNADNLATVKKIRGFKTFELCQSAAISELRSPPNPDDGDYECGYKCEYDPNMEVDLCKETRK